jgi:orotidine-5'-phosphate decarboxylase
MSFVHRVVERSRRLHSLLCVGLDPVQEQLPPSIRDTASPVLFFNQSIVEATADWACAFKPNIAFYEALGPAGLEILQATISFIHEHTSAPVIVDAKRADVGHTCTAYARALFDYLQADAVTLSPYLGGEALSPFLDREDRGCFLLCRTSNPGAGEFQDLLVNGRPLYQAVAAAVRRWNTKGNCGLVVGATFPDELAQIRALCPEMPLLIPGVGAQKGDLAGAVQAGVDGQGEKILINASRSILYASSGSDFAAGAARAAQELCEAINEARPSHEDTR